MTREMASRQVAALPANSIGQAKPPRPDDSKFVGSVSPRELPETFLGPKEIRARFGVTKGEFRTFIARNGFPMPHQVLRQGRVWLAEEVDEWADTTMPAGNGRHVEGAF